MFVPLDKTPSFVEALRAATKYFQKETNPYGLTTFMNASSNNDGDNDEMPTNDVSNSAASSLRDSIMARLDAAAETPEEVQRRLDYKKRQDDMISSIEKWLEQVKRFVPKTNYRNSSSSAMRYPTDETAATEEEISPNNQTKEPRKETISVPAACFLYVWGMQQDHPRVTVRRAALFLSAHLLERSKDCRHYLDQDDNLSTWITAVSDHSKTVWKNPETAAKQLPLFQQESSMLLSRLVDQGYSSIYPKLGVAAHRIKQCCPQRQLETLESTRTGISNMVDWRRWRDAALCYEQKEIDRLEKLIGIGN